MQPLIEVLDTLKKQSVKEEDREEFAQSLRYIEENINGTRQDYLYNGKEEGEVSENKIIDELKGRSAGLVNAIHIAFVIRKLHAVSLKYKNIDAYEQLYETCQVPQVKFGDLDEEEKITVKILSYYHQCYEKLISIRDLNFVLEGDIKNRKLLLFLWFSVVVNDLNVMTMLERCPSSILIGFCKALLLEKTSSLNPLVYAYATNNKILRLYLLTNKIKVFSEKRDILNLIYSDWENILPHLSFDSTNTITVSNVPSLTVEFTEEELNRLTSQSLLDSVIDTQDIALFELLLKNNAKFDFTKLLTENKMKLIVCLVAKMDDEQLLDHITKEIDANNIPHVAAILNSVEIDRIDQLSSELIRIIERGISEVLLACNEECAKRLVSNVPCGHSCLTVCGINGNTLLHSLIIAEQFTLADQILEKMRPSDLTIKNINGNTVLHELVLTDQKYLTKKVIEQFPVNSLLIRNKQGETVLRTACKQLNEYALTELLRKMPLDILLSAKSHNGNNIFDYAIRIKCNLFFEKIIELIQDNQHERQIMGMSYCEFLSTFSPNALKHLHKIHPDVMKLLHIGFCREYRVTKYHGAILNNLMALDIESTLSLLKLSIDSATNNLTFCILERNPKLCLIDDNGKGKIIEYILEKRSTSLVINILKWLELQNKMDIELLLLLLKQYSSLSSNLELFRIFSLYAKEIFKLSLENKEVDVIKHILKILPHCYVDNQSGILFNWECCANSINLFKTLINCVPETLSMLEEIVTNNPETLDIAGTLLHEAVEHGNSILVSKILQAAPKAIMVFNEEGYSPLHLAVGIGAADIISIILENTPDSLNLLDKDNFSPIHWAVGMDKGYIVRMMLESNPNVLTLKGANDRTALHYAIYNQKINAIDIILEFLTNDALALQDVNGDTALHVAVKKGYADIVSKIIHYISEEIINLTNNRGFSPLQLAIGSKKTKVASLILDAFPSAINMFFNDGLTPIHTAISVGAVDCVELILKKYPNAAHLCDRNGRTAREFADQYRNQDVIAMLSSLCQDIENTPRV